MANGVRCISLLLDGVFFSETRHRHRVPDDVLSVADRNPSRLGKAESALEVNIMSDRISFRLNDKPVRLNVDANRVLLWILRTDLGLTGAKFGCGEGHCGACTVLVDKVAVRSCLLTARDVCSG